MNLESSRSIPTSIRPRRIVRYLAIAVIATIPLAGCSSGDSDEPRADDLAEPTTTSDDGADPPPPATLPPESSAPATVAPPSEPEVQEAIGIAQRFVEARDRWDGEAVRALVSDDAMLDDFGVTNVDLYLPGAEFERVTGWRYMQPECKESVPGPPIQVPCTYTMQNAWSEAIGVGPFTGSSFRFRVADGQIQQVRHNFDYSMFDAQVFTVFSMNG